MEEILAVFNWSALAITSIGTAFAVVVANQTSKGSSIHNAWIAFGSAIVFAGLTTNWGNFSNEWQAIILQFLITMLVASVIGFNSFQSVVDAFVGTVLKKAGVKKEESGQ